MIYTTTMLPATNDPAEISKCFLDLLKKLNDVSSSIPTISANGPSIYASGSNSNGHYIQFADGTMECWYVSSNLMTTNGDYQNPIYYSSGAAFTFPIPFVGNPPLVNPVRQGGAASFSWGAENNGFPTLLGTLIYYCSLGSTITLYPGYRAIGRWK